MTLPFSRSVRSLDIDSYRASRIGMILAIVVMILLLLWFFFAKVTLFEISSDISLTEDGHVVANFPNEAIRRIKPGQPAILRAQVGPDQATLTLSAIVIRTDRTSGQAEIVVLSEEGAVIPLLEELSGQVQVEVEYVTPATLVRRASGSYLNNSQFPVSPQEINEH